MKKIIYLILSFIFVGCSDFLTEYSQDQAYVKSYVDVDELLLGNGYMYRYTTLSYTSTPTYYPYIHYMSDDLEFNSETSSGHSFMYGYYTWQYNVYEDFDGTKVWDEGLDFRRIYLHINSLNTILELIKEYVSDDNLEEDKININRIIGEAHFLRGSYYFILANLYGIPYNITTADTDLAVPIKLSQYIENKDFSRNTVKEVYDLILEDLHLAESYLEDVPKKSIYRADINTTLLLLSRVYLYMHNYKEAKVYAQKVVDAIPQLKDLNHLTETDTNFLIAKSPELIFSMGSSSFYSNIVNSKITYNSYQVSRDLYNTYNPNDLRKNIFFKSNDSNIFYEKQFGTHSVISDLSDVFVLRTAEAYLNLAEAAAIEDDMDKAYETMNAFLKNRIDKDYFDPNEIKRYKGEELVNFIREERRKELCLEGHRWFDLRRYQHSTKYPYYKTIEHNYYLFVHNPEIYGYELVESRKYSLEPNDPAWTLRLPKDELDRNPSMIDNPRNERSYITID